MYLSEGTKKAHPLQVEDERITRGTTSIQYAEKAYPHSGTYHTLSR